MMKFSSGDGVWRTIGGRRVFIQEGESLSSAMKKSGKFTREQKKAGVQVKESDLDKNIKDMDEDELKAHLNKLESGMDDFDQDEPEFKQLQKEYNEAKKALDVKSKGSEDKYDKAVKEGTFSKEEADYIKAGDDFRKGKISQEELEQAKRDYEHATDKFEHYKFNGADDEDRVKYKEAKDKAYDEYVKKQREYDENRLKPSSGSDLESARAKMLKMESTLDDFENDDDLRGSKEHKAAIKEYNQAKSEYDKISNSLREAKASNDAKQKTMGDRIMGKSEQTYSQKDLDNVWKKEDATEVYNTLTRSERNKLAQAHDDADNFNNQSAKEYIKKMDNEAAKRYLDKQNSSGSNVAYKSAYEDYMKKHPNSKLSFKQFVNMSEGK